LSSERGDAIRSVVIVGGGSAGWMCAAALGRMAQYAGLSVTLIESEEIGAVGVGEATIPHLHVFNALLDFDEDEFVRETQATFKLGIEFVDWWRVGHRYLHPFGVAGRDLLGIKFHQIWLRLRQDPRFARITGSLHAYNVTATAARLNRFTRPRGAPTSVLAGLRYAFHFDATLYAQFLRRYSERRGVKRVAGRIVDCTLRAHDGFLEALVLSDGRRIHGELFLDCSGFQGLLIEKALAAGFESWDDQFPCDRAVVVPSASVRPLMPYTRATADSAGWRWRIPLQHRVGNGYVYSSRHSSDDAAAARLVGSLDASPSGEPRFIRFAVGRRRAAWVRNCIAIGLSAGFLEPLESTGIYLIQSAIQKLMALFPDRHFSRLCRDEFNRQTALEYELIRDFILFHYLATDRDDTPFWREIKARRMPQSLEDRIEAFRTHGRVLRRAEDLFTDDSWIAVMLGQGVMPRGYDPLVDSLPIESTSDYLRQMQSLISQACAALPEHEKFIAIHCAAASFAPASRSA
jgi:tryptophan 7-halogenase